MIGLLFDVVEAAIEAAPEIAAATIEAAPLIAETVVETGLNLLE